MTWTRLSDDYADETWSLSDAGFRMMTELLCYTNRYLLNCVVPMEDIRRFAKNPEALGELVDGGWVDLQGKFVVIKYHAMFQRSREAVQNQQAANVKNRARRGLATAPGRVPKFVEESSNESLNEWTNESLNERIVGQVVQQMVERKGRDVKKKDLQETFVQQENINPDSFYLGTETGEVIEHLVLTSSEDYSDDDIF